MLVDWLFVMLNRVGVNRCDFFIIYFASMIILSPKFAYLE